MIRVLVVDDEYLVRSGLRMILETADDIVVVAEARDGAEAEAAVRRHRPNVVLMDVRMPGVDGLSAARRIRDCDPAASVIMLTTFDLDEYVHTALRNGAVGFLLKDTPPRDLIAAVRVVCDGKAMLSPTVTRRLITTFADRGTDVSDAARDQLKVLTDRELDVIRALGTGMSNAEIGRAVGMTEATVKSHVSRCLAKLGMTNRVQAAILVHDADLDR